VGALIEVELLAGRERRRGRLSPKGMASGEGVVGPCRPAPREKDKKESLRILGAPFVLGAVFFFMLVF
jgi:hypothetical protein